MQSRKSGVAGIGLAITALVASLVPMARQARAAESETVLLNVDGMWNEGCEDYISDSLLGDIEGIEQVHADHEEDFVSVEFDPAATSPEEIAAAIEDCPFFDVTGSETHELSEELIQSSRSSCCYGNCRHRDA